MRFLRLMVRRTLFSIVSAIVDCFNAGLRGSLMALYAKFDD